MLQAWNIQTNAEFSLSAPAGQVHAMEVGNEMLFAGTQVKSLTVLQVISFSYVLGLLGYIFIHSIHGALV